ncbi:hypothetical protein B0I37DRAFT_9246 [Chaetomium sp. MPI-CAGE-AT-0009]|nr:hypothetical protein B0I37DRAFT_9246 [Chaetomium sp. MPI-CAGE-AT-0009]
MVSVVFISAHWLIWRCSKSDFIPSTKNRWSVIAFHPPHPSIPRSSSSPFCQETGLAFRSRHRQGRGERKEAKQRFDNCRNLSRGPPHAPRAARGPPRGRWRCRWRLALGRAENNTPNEPLLHAQAHPILRASSHQPRQETEARGWSAQRRKKRGGSKKNHLTERHERE